MSLFPDLQRNFEVANIPSVKKVSPQNGGFIRAKLTRPKIFCYRNNVRNIQNGGFIRAKLTRPRIFCYKNNVRNIPNGGFIRAKSGPLILHQARILYLLILWVQLSVIRHQYVILGSSPGSFDGRLFRI